MCSVLVYLLIHFIFNLSNLKLGLIVSIFIPIVVTLPLSFLMANYHNKIDKQKEELRKLNVLNKNLFSAISHDIRSPIASIKSFADLIANEDVDLEKGKIYLGLVSKRVDNLLVFLNDLMNWSKRQIDQLPQKQIKFNGKKIIKSILELYSDQIKDKNLKIDLENVDVDIVSDKEGYSFITRNIIHNAIKFSKVNGEISILIHSNDDTITTSIRDTGIGILQENIDKILNEGEVFTTQGTSNEIGSGFGIVMCKKYIELLKGSIQINSTPNKGTVISIILPK